MYSILIVDDEPIIRRGIKTFIDFEKYNINRTSNKDVLFIYNIYLFNGIFIITSEPLSVEGINIPYSFP